MSEVFFLDDPQPERHGRAVAIDESGRATPAQAVCSPRWSVAS
jgi:hypothetical protein